MDKNQESSSSIEASEEEEEAQSEHGSTTDAENEEICYWESLRKGILRFPAPLRLQSLLFIIGHLDQYRNESLALLPPRTRRELLLNLPVVDVCRLEGSGVTEGIDMEEVWKTLYYNRLPTHQKEFEKFLTTVDDREEMDSSWKDCYFSSVFDIRMHRPEDNDCNCIYGRHLQQDLLYGMYTYNGTLELQECFGPRSGPCFDVETYTRRCCRLTPSCYISQFPEAISIALRRRAHCPPTTIYATIRTFVGMCKFAPMTFSASDEGLKDHFGNECFTDDYFFYWKSFLGNVCCLEIFQVKRLHPGWKYIMDAIFCNTQCKLNELYISVFQGDSKLMAFLAPYFSSTPGSDTSAVPYAHLRRVHIDGAIKSVCDALNTELILNHQNNLEVVMIDDCNCFKSGRDAPITLAPYQRVYIPETYFVQRKRIHFISSESVARILQFSVYKPSATFLRPCESPDRQNSRGHIHSTTCSSWQ